MPKIIPNPVQVMHPLVVLYPAGSPAPSLNPYAALPREPLHTRDIFVPRGSELLQMKHRELERIFTHCVRINHNGDYFGPHYTLQDVNSSTTVRCYPSILSIWQPSNRSSLRSALWYKNRMSQKPAVRTTNRTTTICSP